MCGRYTKEFTDHIANYHEHLRDFLDGLDAVSQYNVAPATTQSIRCADGQQMIVGDAKWGLIPFWSKDGKGYQINARSETVLEKPMFTQAFARRRCVTWATGYYEWQTSASGGKQPYFIHFADHRPFFFYGIWGTWTNPESKQMVTTFATMTTNPVNDLEFIHDRMPCIVDVDSPDVAQWLDHTSQDYYAKQRLLHPFEKEKLVATPVSKYVNNVRNQGPKCIEPDVGRL